MAKDKDDFLGRFSRLEKQVGEIDGKLEKNKTDLLGEIAKLVSGTNNSNSEDEDNEPEEKDFLSNLLGM
jgi:hypothetical protein